MVGGVNAVALAELLLGESVTRRRGGGRTCLRAAHGAGPEGVRTDEPVTLAHAAGRRQRHLPTAEAPLERVYFLVNAFVAPERVQAVPRTTRGKPARTPK